MISNKNKGLNWDACSSCLACFYFDKIPPPAWILFHTQLPHLERIEASRIAVYPRWDFP